MSAVAQTVEKLLANEIGMLRGNAEAIARKLEVAQPEACREILKAEEDANEIFLSLAVFDPEGAIARGENPTAASARVLKYAQRARAQGFVISTTERTAAGELVIYVCVPMDRFVLSAAIPGMFFNDLLSDIKIRETGLVFVADGEGTMIANRRSNAVEGRLNYIERAKTDSEFAESGAFFEKMLQTDEGMGKYESFGIERICVYKKISGSRDGWVIAAAAPFSESPSAYLRTGLLWAAFIFVAFGFIAALFASKILAKPFYRIEEQNERLEKLNAFAQKAANAKGRFFAKMSHEMRTPLNAIIGLSELSIRSGEASRETERNLEKIHASGTTLLKIVNDILDISKLESRKFRLIPANYDTASLINDIVTLNSILIGEKPIAFKLRIDGKLPSELRGDELRIKQIIGNLLSNAFKYTREGVAELTLSAERKGEDVWLTARVTDTGIGIRGEDIEKLFSDYNQVDAESNRNIEGTGLGLAIVKRLTEMMDGGVDVLSEYGKGSTFTARMRQGFVTERTLDADVVRNLQDFRYADEKRSRDLKFSRAFLPNARVLVVDDAETNRDVIKGMLGLYGMRVDCVESGSEAIERIRAREEIYDAVFMDNMMPEPNGIETVRIIRNEIAGEYAKTVPIIALTANANKECEQTFLSSGFQAFLTKPVDIRRLDTEIRRWVGNGIAQTSDGTDDRKCARHSAPATSDECETACIRTKRIPGVNLEKAWESFDQNDEILSEILQSYAENTPPLLKEMRARAENSLSEYAIIAHGIKGSSYAICAQSVGEQAEALEHAAGNGDLPFVRRNSASFFGAVEKLTADISAALSSLNAKAQKPTRERPDWDVLTALSRACSDYDMDGIDQAMRELERFEYEHDRELIRWLKEHVLAMDFAIIKDRLSKSA
jgi:signal transduction histidine kinase/CheY-like chemotaxis protein